MKGNINNPPQVSGIDALYYFAQSGGGYDAFYMNIIEQIEDRKAEFQALVNGGVKIGSIKTA